MDDLRIFKMIKLEDIYPDHEGKYLGKTPLQAARKAFNKYCQINRLEEGHFSFVLEEMTDGRLNKKYYYLGQRQKLEPPIELKRGETVYFIKFRNHIKKSKVKEMVE